MSDARTSTGILLKELRIRRLAGVKRVRRAVNLIRDHIPQSQRFATLIFQEKLVKMFPRMQCWLPALIIREPMRTISHLATFHVALDRGSGALRHRSLSCKWLAFPDLELRAQSLQIFNARFRVRNLRLELGRAAPSNPQSVDFHPQRRPPPKQKKQ